MGNIQKRTPRAELWYEREVMAHLGCDIYTARKVMGKFNSMKNLKRYGVVEKDDFLLFLAEMEREDREREARHQSDLANIETTSILKEQVETIKEQVSVLRDQVSVLRDQVSVLREQVPVLKEQVSVLKEQVHTLEKQHLDLEKQGAVLSEMSRASTDDARKARIIAIMSAIASFLAIVVSAAPFVYGLYRT